MILTATTAQTLLEQMKLNFTVAMLDGDMARGLRLAAAMQNFSLFLEHQQAESDLASAQPINDETEQHLAGVLLRILLSPSLPVTLRPWVMEVAGPMIHDPEVRDVFVLVQRANTLVGSGLIAELTPAIAVITHAQHMVAEVLPEQALAGVFLEFVQYCQQIDGQVKGYLVETNKAQSDRQWQVLAQLLRQGVVVREREWSWQLQGRSQAGDIANDTVFYEHLAQLGALLSQETNQSAAAEIGNNIETTMTAMRQRGDKLSPDMLVLLEEHEQQYTLWRDSRRSKLAAQKAAEDVVERQIANFIQQYATKRTTGLLKNLDPAMVLLEKAVALSETSDDANRKGELITKQNAFSKVRDAVREDWQKLQQAVEQRRWEDAIALSVALNQVHHIIGDSTAGDIRTYMAQAAYKVAFEELQTASRNNITSETMEIRERWLRLLQQLQDGLDDPQRDYVRHLERFVVEQRQSIASAQVADSRTVLLQTVTLAVSQPASPRVNTNPVWTSAPPKGTPSSGQTSPTQPVFEQSLLTPEANVPRNETGLENAVDKVKRLTRTAGELMWTTPTVGGLAQNLDAAVGTIKEALGIAKTRLSGKAPYNDLVERTKETYDHYLVIHTCVSADLTNYEIAKKGNDYTEAISCLKCTQSVSGWALLGWDQEGQVDAEIKFLQGLIRYAHLHDQWGKYENNQWEKYKNTTLLPGMGDAITQMETQRASLRQDSLMILKEYQSIYEQCFNEINKNPYYQKR